MSPEMLYSSSILSGLSNLTWDEFSGQTVSIGQSRQQQLATRSDPTLAKGC
jgi:hypothetical protein